ncbi:hypothetical protein [Chitinophaga sp. CF418]|uniref:hypothetical protein n=1 Tax=Chitinophaga sp. CF418 TaxID=1855287 RepID=UPI000915A3C3|nr:hypothetical protein [Chitinophaga sp. CF418]SHN45940.1 hypothetical protein SAMN05216311_12240 [Chitinophaga sp. CF418]
MAKDIKFALILAATDKASAVIKKAFANAEKHAKGLSNVGNRMQEIGEKGMVAGGIMTAFFGKTIADARESAIAQAKVIQGYETMGRTAKEAQELIDFAGKKQYEWGIVDEKIVDAGGKLGTFSNLFVAAAKKNDIFNRSLQAAFDLQAKGFGDASANAVQLGKAMQDPVRGAAALSKTGTLNKSDIAIIKQIAATKGLGAAQLYIIKAIEKQVKGTAAAAADPLKVLEIGAGDTSEAIGNGLLPQVNKYAKSLGQTMPKVIAFADKHRPLILAIAKASVGLLAFSAGLKVVGFAFSGLSTTITTASKIAKFSREIGLAGKIAAGAKSGFDAMKFGAFAMQYHLKFSVIPALKAAGTSVIKFGATLLASPITWYVLAAVALAAVVYVVIRNWDKISAFFARLWQGIKNLFSKFVQWAKFLFMNFTPYGLIIQAWMKLAPHFGEIWEKVKDVFKKAWQWIANLGGKFLDAGKNIVSSIAKGMVAMAQAPVKAIMAIVKKIRNFLPFSPAKEGALRDIHKVKLVETIAQSITAKPLVSAMGKATDQLYNQLNSPRPVYNGSRSNVTQITFSPTIQLSGTATQSDAQMISDNLRSEFKKMLRDYEMQKGRVAFG